MKRYSLKAILPLVFCLNLYLPCSAQEIQVPLDMANNLDYINTDMAKRLGLFSEYENFLEARLFQVSDSSWILEVSYQPLDRLIRKRIPFSESDLSDFRMKLDQLIERKEPKLGLDQSGRTRFLVGTFTLAANYGWAVPVALDIQDSKSFVAMYMLSASAGFYIPLFLTSDLPVTEGTASLSIYGGSRGIAHGVLLNMLLAGDNSTFRSMISLGVLGSIIEGAQGFRYASRTGMTEGIATVIAIGGDFGLGCGGGTAYMLDLFEESTVREAGLTMLAGSGIGLWMGKRMADGQSYTRGDAYVLQTTGITGTVTAITLTDLLNIRDEKVFVGSAMLGSLLGLRYGDKIVRNKDFTTGQGRLMTLGTSAGGLLGLGFAYLLASDNDDATPYLTGFTLGSIISFKLMYNAYKPEAQTRANQQAFSFSILPDGLAALALGGRFNDRYQNTPPILALKWRF